MTLRRAIHRDVAVFIGTAAAVAFVLAMDLYQSGTLDIVASALFGGRAS